MRRFSLIDVTPISVVIPARNEGQRLSRTISSIVTGRSCLFPLEIVVVDDGSTDGCCDTLANLTCKSPNVTVVLRRLDAWYGIPYARNRGMESASNSICFITDGNTYFPLNWDLPIWEHFHRSRLIAGTIADLASSFRGYGCTLLLPSMGVSWIPRPGLFGGYVPVTACSCTVIDRSLFHHLGGYDESLPLYGAAEPEFSIRAWLSGYEIVNVPNLLIHHWFRPRTQYDSFRTSIQDILLHNYVRFACYYLPDSLLQAALDHYAADMPGSVNTYLDGLLAEGVWSRRADLKRTLRHDFSWFADKFSLYLPEARTSP